MIIKFFRQFNLYGLHGRHALLSYHIMLSLFYFDAGSTISNSSSVNPLQLIHQLIDLSVNDADLPLKGGLFAVHLG